MATREQFIYFPAPDPLAPCQVRLAGVSECDGTYAIRRTKPEDSVMEYVAKGRGALTVDGKTYHPEAGDVYLLLPGKDHHYQSSADRPWTKLWFNIAGPLVPQLALLHGLGATPHIPSCPAKPMFERGHRIARRDPAASQGALALLFHEILQLASRSVKEQRGNPVPETARRLRAHLDAHWKEALSLDDMAAVAGRSRAQAVRLFRAAFGMPPYRYHLMRRLAQAQALLSGTALAVREVARETGFDDEYHFAALFKRQLGMAPGMWRQRATTRSESKVEKPDPSDGRRPS